AATESPGWTDGNVMPGTDGPDPACSASRYARTRANSLAWKVMLAAPRNVRPSELEVGMPSTSPRNPRNHRREIWRTTWLQSPPSQPPGTSAESSRWRQIASVCHAAEL